jgi:hypothetical protein
MEYMAALPSRQREIVDNQKNPLANKPKITWCANARKKIIEFFAGGCADESILDNEIERLQESIERFDEKDPKKLESKIRKIQVEIDAINSFKGLHKKLDLKGVMFSKASNKPKYLDYSGVHVSVRPEILVTAKTWEHIGCLKLYLIKNHRLEDQDADFLCSVLNHYADKYLSPIREETGETSEVAHSSSGKETLELSASGHFAAWLQFAPDGTITWKA